MDWSPPAKPAELAEKRLVQAILDGSFPVNSSLPPERELSAMLGITRPTLREALQRLARDGWVDIHHGRPTRVKNYWEEGSLAVLASIAQRQQNLPPDFVPNLLFVRRLLAPAYTRLAIEQNPAPVIQMLQAHAGLPDEPAAFSHADLDLHCQLTISSQNPVFTLILNGFRDLYIVMGERYFQVPAARKHSRAFYADLLDCARRRDGSAAESITAIVMAESLNFWQALGSAAS